MVVGGAAIGAVVSEWLLAFSLFLFLALALVKRYSEFAAMLDANVDRAANRAYRAVDLPILSALAAASGFNAVTVFALYTSSDAVRALYTKPELLWLAIPVIVYWISRTILLAHRRKIHDDPVVFALKDTVSLCCRAMVAIVLFAAGPT